MAIPPAATPSNMSINDMPEDCLRLVLEQVASQSTLNEIFQKAFISQKWFITTVRMMASRNGSTSLKLFDSPRNLEFYCELLDKTKLPTIDQRFALMNYNNNTEEIVTWKQMDHLILNTITDITLNSIINALERFFSQTVTHLVINTLNLDLLQVLEALPKVTSLTLIELPENRHIQKRLLNYLANSMTSLRQLHIFYMENSIPLDAQTLRPVLARLEAFTLYSYSHTNRNVLFAALNPTIIRYICVGTFTSFRESLDIEEEFKAIFPHLWPRVYLHEKKEAYQRRTRIIRQMLIDDFTAHRETRPEYNFLAIPPDMVVAAAQANRQHWRQMRCDFIHDFIQQIDIIPNTVPDQQATEQYRQLFNHLMVRFRAGTWRPRAPLII